MDRSIKTDYRKLRLVSMVDAGKKKWATLQLRKGEFLFKQGDGTHDLYIIKSGKIRIFKTEDNLDIVLDIVGPGMVIGEIAFIDNGCRSASGVATEDCELTVVPSAESMTVLSKIPEYFRKIALILVQRLREVDSRIHHTIDGDQIYHVAAIISLVAYSPKCVQCDDGFQIDRIFLENEIVDLLNITLSEVISILARMENEGKLRQIGGNVILKQKNSLDSLAEIAFKQTAEIPAI
jgi:CRP/FNR family transcriptional regulator